MQSIPRTLRRALVGKPIHNERFGDAVLPKRTALPVFSADALSSVAYAPDEIILTLALAGTTAVAVSPWVGLAVLVVLAVVITAYRQNVRAYPSGGGDYEIVSKNLGRTAGVGVGAALMADYALVVAVSMATAAQYVTAAVPSVAGWRVELAVAGILFVGLLNLRGLKFMGRAAAVPTYFFLAVLAALLLVGLVQDLTGSLGDAPSAGREVLPAAGFDAGLAGLAGALVVLRAFSSGAVALTGVETITNSVPYFRKPRAANAAATLGVLGALSAALLAGVMYLADRTDVVVVGDPEEQLLVDGRLPGPDFFQDPVLGQLAKTVFGTDSVWFFVLVAATVGVLVLAANTAFSGFPTLASRLARDAFLPRQLQARGDRFAFTNGILLLLLVAVVLTVAFGANVNGLIQLYIVGVFVSFTLTQAGMVRHWARVRRMRPHPGIRRELFVRRAVALIAFVLCAAVLVVVLVTKLTQGAWITLVAIAVLSAVMAGIRRHYDAVDAELALQPDSPVRALPSRVHAIIYVSSVRKPLMRALAYARASRPSTLEAVVVDTNAASTRRILAEWQRLEIPVPVTVLHAPYRDTIGPVLDHVRGVRRKSPPGPGRGVPARVRGAPPLGAAAAQPGHPAAAGPPAPGARGHDGLRALAPVLRLRRGHRPRVRPRVRHRTRPRAESRPAVTPTRTPEPAETAGPAELELRLGPVAHGGHTVARTGEGRVVFVRHGLPGELVRVRLTDSGPAARFWRGDVVDVLEADARRRTEHVWAPADPLLSWPRGRPPVGGAEFGHAELEAQRELKAAVVAEQLSRLAGLETPVTVEAMPGEDPRGLGWRTRAHFAVDPAGRIGMHPHRSAEIVPVDSFPLVVPAIDDLRLGRLDLRGVQRVDVAAPAGGGTPLVHLGLADGADRRRLRRELARLTADRDVSVTARAEGQREPELWAGRPAVVEHAGPHRWEVSAEGFWQIHRAAPELLHRTVPGAAGARPGEHALDLYAGAGLFTAALADAVGPAGTVLAVEGSPVTSADARRAFAARPQVRVDRGSVDAVLARTWPQAAPNSGRGRRRPSRGRGAARPDVVVLDPPRAGAGRTVVDQLVALAPRRIAYLACDPATLARDLGRFRRAGWTVREVRAFDMYPNTHHVETLAVLEP